METVSKNTDSQPNEPNKDDTPKPKRGRPRTRQRQLIEMMPEAGHGSASQRNRMNEKYALTFWGHVVDATEEEQLALLGCRWNQCTYHFPKGSVTAATEIGRYMEWCCESKDNERMIFQQVLHMRQEGLEWKHIKGWYRERRLGKRRGNYRALTSILTRAIDDYKRQFAGTDYHMMVEALDHTMEAVMEWEQRRLMKEKDKEDAA